MRPREAYLILAHDDKATRELVLVRQQQILQHRYLIRTALIVKAKQDNTAIRGALAIYLLAKVFVVCDQNPLLVVRTANPLIVRYARRLVEDRNRVMALAREPLRDRRTGAFVNEKTHELSSLQRHKA